MEVMFSKIQFTPEPEEVSPLVVVPAFFRFLFDECDQKAKEKLEARAKQSIKLLARHLSVYAIEAEAIQWMATPFITIVTNMVKDPSIGLEGAIEFIKTFCQLRNHQARFEVYLVCMAQGENQFDAFRRQIDSQVEGIKIIFRKFDGWLNELNAKVGDESKLAKTAQDFRSWAKKFRDES